MSTAAVFSTPPRPVRPPPECPGAPKKKLRHLQQEDTPTPSEIRPFHNHVKAQLLQSATREETATRLLDIGVGRGGDLHKWVSMGIERVWGMDIDESALEEARHRTAAKEIEIGRTLRYEYSTELPNERRFDIVSCQFAIHYFCDSADHLDELLTNVAARLRNRGRFLVTCMHGDLVRALPKPWDNGLLQIQSAPEGPDTAIDVCMKETVYFDAPKREHLVVPDELIAACAAKRMYLVNHHPKGFSEYLPGYRRRHLLSNLEMQTSSLFVSFEFVLIQSLNPLNLR
jgi:SAM-dependent methyltransferase